LDAAFFVDAVLFVDADLFVDAVLFVDAAAFFVDAVLFVDADLIVDAVLFVDAAALLRFGCNLSSVTLPSLGISPTDSHRHAWIRQFELGFFDRSFCAP
jgi:hypothetical protein